VRKLSAVWEKMAIDGDHYEPAFDQPRTWSQKYNLVWDELLDIHLFPERVMDTEWTFYTRQVQRYGLPLDNRKTITKAGLGDVDGEFSQQDGTVSGFDSSPCCLGRRNSFTDAHYGLLRYGQRQANGIPGRSVVGGVFIKALMLRQSNKR
jgi:hypothetical protein